MPANKRNTVLTKDEKRLVEMYRLIRSPWERGALYLLIQSLAWGRLTAKTDGYTWDQLRRTLGLPRQKAAARHG